MKIAVTIAVLALTAGGYFMMSHRAPHLTPEQAAKLEWSRTTREPVTAVRPARFEAMKWHPPTDNEGVELRAPASTKKSHK